MVKESRVSWGTPHEVSNHARITGVTSAERPQYGLNMTAINLQLNKPEWHLQYREGGVMRWMAFVGTMPEHRSIAAIDRCMTREATELIWTVHVYDVQNRPPSDHYLRLAKQRRLPNLAASIYLRTDRKELLGLDQYQAEGVVYVWLPTSAFDSFWTGMSHRQEAVETMTLTLITTSPESGLSGSGDSANGEPLAWLIEVENPILIHELEVSIHRSLTAIQLPAG